MLDFKFGKFNKIYVFLLLDILKGGKMSQIGGEVSR